MVGCWLGVGEWNKWISFVGFHWLVDAWGETFWLQLDFKVQISFKKQFKKKKRTLRCILNVIFHLSGFKLEPFPTHVDR